MIIIKSGVLEVFVLIDGNEMVLERLGSESIINYRNIFYQDELMYVNIRCKENAQLMVLSKGDIEMCQISKNSTSMYQKLDQVHTIDVSKNLNSSGCRSFQTQR
jgi:CRP-like cAMP-binding protein